MENTQGGARYRVGEIELPPFRVSGWRRFGFLQTCFVVGKTDPDIESVGKTSRHVVDLSDGTGDRLDLYVRQSHHTSSQDLPVAVLLHGLGGDATNDYMNRAAGSLLRGGVDVVCANARGAGTGRDVADGFHHGGRTEDVRDLVRGLVRQVEPTAGRELVLIGFSLGGHLALKYVAGRRDEPAVVGCVTVSAPLSLDLASRQLGRLRNYLIQRHLLRKVRNDALRREGSLSDAERAVVTRASSFWQLDDVFTAPRHGYLDAADYYQKNSAVDAVHHVRVPTVAFHALDDPFVPNEHPVDATPGNGPLHRVILPNGGHVGFLTDDGPCWIDQCLLTLFESEFWKP